MSDSPEQLSKSIDDRLAEIIHHIAEARGAFAKIAHPGNWTAEAKLDQIRSRVATRCTRFQKEREQVNSKVKRALASAKENAGSWKESGQTEKLRQYANQAEQFAMAAILDADDAIDNALIAAMESLNARALAEEETRQS
jgi:hypothetical protein